MIKPTVFFSHSSKDQKVISKLKEQLVKKTGNSIDFFSSSDGQSVSFGKNWVHSVEKALSESSIMFVFLTPNSIHSNWIYFESGFSYSKGIEVIPIGFLGIDLNELQPPLSLLQGFNITSFEGLNNMVDIMNSKFKFSHEGSFNKEDLFLLEELSLNSKVYSKENILNTIEKIHLTLSRKINNGEDSIEIIDDAFNKAVNYCIDNKVDHRAIGSTLEIHGLSLTRISGSSISVIEDYFFLIKIDPFLHVQNLRHVKELLNLFYNKKLITFFLRITFKEHFEILSETYKISSRLQPYEIGFSQMAKAFKYKQIDFIVDQAKNNNTPSELRLIYKIEDLDTIDIYGLLELLIEAGVILQIED